MLRLIMMMVIVKMMLFIQRWPATAAASSAAAIQSPVSVWNRSGKKRTRVMPLTRTQIDRMVVIVCRLRQTACRGCKCYQISGSQWAEAAAGVWMTDQRTESWGRFQQLTAGRGRHSGRTIDGVQFNMQVWDHGTHSLLFLLQLKFQLLHHLHLNSCLGRWPVVQSVLLIQVFQEGGEVVHLWLASRPLADPLWVQDLLVVRSVSRWSCATAVPGQGAGRRVMTAVVMWAAIHVAVVSIIVNVTWRKLLRCWYERRGEPVQQLIRAYSSIGVGREEESRWPGIHPLTWWPLLSWGRQDLPVLVRVIRKAEYLEFVFDMRRCEQWVEERR